MIEIIYDMLSNYAPLTAKVGARVYYNLLPDDYDFNNDGVIFEVQLNGSLKDLEGNIIAKHYGVEIKVISKDTIELFAIGAIIESLLIEDATNQLRGVELERDRPFKDEGVNAYFLPINFTVTK